MLRPGFSIGENGVEPTKISPNPAKDYIEIESLGNVSTWKLLDVKGQEVKSSKLKVERSFTLDISSLDAGLYFLQMEVNGELVINQLIID